MTEPATSASNPTPLSARAVYLMFFASGASALTYQVIWARWLGLILGNTTLSISIVLGAFMLGLGLGSWLAGRWMPRIQRPMLTYAWLELAIGVYAILLPWLIQASDLVFVRLVSTETPLATGLAVRGVFAFLLLVLPTTFMGATLPLLTEFFRRHPLQTKGWKVGLLYAANTFGAAAGTLVASFLLIELVGVSSTNHAAAVLNFLVAVIGYQLARRLGETAASGQAPKPGPEPAHATLVVAALAMSGATALAAEILWTRPLSALVGNSTYAFATILLVYLTGIALGSWVMSLFVHRLKPLALWLGGLQAATGLWVIAAIWLSNLLHVKLLEQDLPAVTLPQLFGIYVQCISILLPLALLSGAMFPVATKLLQPDNADAEGGAIARAYAWNTFGALAGSLTAGILIAPRMDFYPALYLLAAGYGLSAIIILMWAKKLALLVSASRASLGGLCLLAPIVALTGLKQTSVESPLIARLRTRGDAWEAPFHRPGVQGVTTVLRRKGEPFGSHLLINGRGMTAKVTDTKMMAHLPLLLHPNPENTLVICFGMGTTFRSAITHGGQVTVVELVPDVLDAFDHYHADTAAVRAYPRGRMVANDGRNFLKLTRERYDIITVDPPPPVDAAGVNSLYCRDFVELARTRLKPGGLLAHWIPSPGTGGVNDVATFNMMLSTLYHAFPHTYVLTGIDAHGVHVFSSETPLQYDLQRIKQRLSIPAVARDVTEWRDVPLAFFAALAEIPPAEMAGIPQITDDEPALEFNLLRNWRLGTLQPSPIVPW